MKIALLGYGKMGHEIEKIAIARQHEIVLRIDIDNQHESTAENLKKADVAIDFSTPGSAFDNILKCFNAGVPVVSGTTGWLDKISEVREICKRDNRTLFYASNYSLGVNVFFGLNRYLAELMNKLSGYDVEMTEIHHIHKLDAPSGTAITLANDLIEKSDIKQKWELNQVSDGSSLKISAIREGEVPGTHIITWESDVDKIEIRHEAFSRKGFALGAVLASEFIRDKKGVFSMEDLMRHGIS
jgi:4-hydroxy-tetrahydrodipicolinate reductase